MRRLRTLSPAVSSTEDVRRNEATEDEEDPTVIVHIIMGQVARSCVRDAIRRHLERLGLLSRDADADSSIKRTVSHLLRPVLRKQRRLPRYPIRIQSLRDAHDLPVDDEAWFLETVWRCATMLPVRRSDMVRRVSMLLSQPHFSFAHLRKSDKATKRHWHRGINRLVLLPSTIIIIISSSASPTRRSVARTTSSQTAYSTLAPSVYKPS